MSDNSALLLLVLTPLIGAFILPVAGWVSLRLRNGLALLFVLVSLIAAFKILPAVLAGSVPTVDFNFGFGQHFLLADRLAVFMAIVSSLVGAIIVFYSWGYIRHYRNQNEYYFMVVLFLGAMMGLVFAANLIFLYICWELTAIASWRLIGFYRERPIVVRADKAFLVTFFGAVVMLLAFVDLHRQTGTFDIPQMKAALQGQPIGDLLVLMILVGILSKSATLPLQTWLPDAGVAPSPVTALLHAAVLVKIGVYVFARLLVVTFPLSDMWHTAVPIIAAVSALVSAGAALIETDMKRIIAFSTISQIGFIFFGLAIGSEVAMVGGLLYILMHGLAKGGLFLCAGIVEQNTHLKDITKMGGLIKTMPVTAISFLICAFSVMGIPPFGGFFSKYFVFGGAAATGHLWITLAFVAAAFLTIVYLMRIFVLIFMGESKTPPAVEGSPVMVWSVAILAALSLGCGIFINSSSSFAQQAVRQMLGP
jgi:NADH:ubiquinone oxidoreductase subunit 5 (subunit L)/multisubunit Na+/H+ antiporter MnhA subunit